MNRMGWFFGAIYDFVFPPLPICQFCGARKESAGSECETCKDEWEALKLKGKQKKPYACYYYDGVVKKAIGQYKYSRIEDLAEFLAERIAEMLKSQKVKAEVVSFVPLHQTKRKKRGFDQMQKVAEAVAAEMGLPAARTLKRVKRTLTQAKLTAEKRKQNVKNAFVCDKNTKVSKESAIILVDDVYTTGATMSAAVEALNSAGYANVIPVVFATSKANQ
jgi:competence protein ComFC